MAGRARGHVHARKTSTSEPASTLGSSSRFTSPQAHANTQRRGQQSGCWLLPVGLCSLNCLSDSRLSKFTTRDPALRLPQPLATQRANIEEPAQAHERNPNAGGLTGRLELQTMAKAPDGQSAWLGPLAKSSRRVGLGGIQLRTQAELWKTISKIRDGPLFRDNKGTKSEFTPVVSKELSCRVTKEFLRAYEFSFSLFFCLYGMSSKLSASLLYDFIVIIFELERQKKIVPLDFF